MKRIDRIRRYRKGKCLAALCLSMILAGCGGEGSQSRIPGEEAPESREELSEEANEETGASMSREEPSQESPASGEAEAEWVIDTAEGPSRKPEADGEEREEHYTHSAGKVFQNMEFTYAETGERYTVKDSYGVLKLGKMQWEDLTVDDVYDTAFNVIFQDGIYKMWWCRACPLDTIWYAESRDMKNWYNAQCVIDLKDIRTTYMKVMLSWPSVLYVNGKYHMFFEAPAYDTGYSNNIFYATSEDGLDWKIWPEEGEPQPVIADPIKQDGVYGVGQPKAFYMDGYFYVTYTDATVPGNDRIRIARSRGDGCHFEGEQGDHAVLLSTAAGASIRYNAANQKYYMLVSADSVQPDGNWNGNLYLMESEDLYHWPCTTREELLTDAVCLTRPEVVTKKSNSDFVTDPHGIVRDENMLYVYMDGVLPPPEENHMSTYTTWDGNLAVITAGECFGREFILPDGREATAENLIWYEDRQAEWKRPSAEAAWGAPEIDGIRDAVYDESSEVLMETVAASYYGDTKPTKTTGKASFVWNEDALYLYAEVYDATGVFTGCEETQTNLWRNDSLVLFLDVPNAFTGEEKDQPIDALDYTFILDADGNWVAKDSGENNINYRFEEFEICTGRTEEGYFIEAKMPWYGFVKNKIEKGRSVALDLVINDNFGTEGDREGQVCWSDYQGDDFIHLDHYGELILK